MTPPALRTAYPLRVVTRPDTEELPAAPREETTLSSLELFDLEFSLGSESLENLEATSRYVTQERLEATFRSVTELLEIVVLRTCQRVEVYLWTGSSRAVDAASRALLPAELRWSRHEGENAIRHLFRVAAGLESIAIGEREIRDQVRSAAGRVLSRSSRPALRPLLLAAVEAADRAAPEVPVGRSMAAIASAQVLEESPMQSPRVLVAGSGTVGRQVSELLASSCRVALAYRSRPPDEEFLRSTGSRAVPWTALRDELAVSDVLVFAAKSGDCLFGAGLLSGRTAPLLVIDLGVPRNVDPAIGQHPGVRLIDLAGLRRRSQAGPAPGVETEIDRGASELARSIRALGLEVWVDCFRRDVERRRKELVERSRSFLGSLTPSQEEAVERLTQRLATALLDTPTRGLRSIPPGPEGDALRRWALRWLGPGLGPS